MIYNPAARGGKAEGGLDDLRRACPGAEIAVTDGPGHARLLAREMARGGAGVVVAAGGDGTVNEVVNGIAGAGVALGVLPMGTMNVFAAQMGLPVRDLGACWEVARGANEREIDLPMANADRFVQLAGVGFDAEVLRATRREDRRTLNPLNYIAAAAGVAARCGPRVRVEVAGGARREGSFVLIGNGRLFGGPFALFPEARPDDGLLDAIVFQHRGHLDIVRYIRAVVFGGHLTLPDVEYFQGARIVVDGDGDGTDVPYEIDGDLHGFAPVEFRIDERRLRVRVGPRSSPGGGGRSGAQIRASDECGPRDSPNFSCSGMKNPG